MNKRLLQFATRHRVLLCALALATLPWVLPYEALAVNILVFGLFAVGFNLLFGYTGMLSFGHAAFLGAGSYAFGVAMVHFGWPWWLALPFSVLFSMLVGAIVGALAIRTRGIYFSMVTLALGQCIYTVAYQAESLTGGENGLRGVSIAPIQIAGFTFDIVNPSHQVLLHLADRGAGALVRVPGSGIALWRRTGSHPRERTARRSMRLQRQSQQAAGIRHIGRHCVAWRARCAPCICRSCRSTRCTT